MRSKKIIQAVRAHPSRHVEASEAQFVRPADVPLGVAAAVRSNRTEEWAVKEQDRRDRERAAEQTENLISQPDRHGTARQGRARGAQPKTKAASKSV